MKNLTFDSLPEAVAGLYHKLNTIERLLKEQSHPPQPETDQLLTVIEAADFLNLSVPTIYGYCQRQEIPVNKRGKRLYFSQYELTEWIKAGRRKTVDEIESEAVEFLRERKQKRG